MRTCFQVHWCWVAWPSQWCATLQFCTWKLEGWVRGWRLREVVGVVGGRSSRSVVLLWMCGRVERNVKSEARNPWGVIGFSILTSVLDGWCLNQNMFLISCFFLLLKKGIFKKWRHAIWNRFLVVGAVFFSPLNPLEQDHEEEEYHDRLDVSRKFHHCSKWRHDQDAVFWKKTGRGTGSVWKVIWSLNQYRRSCSKAIGWYSSSSVLIWALDN